MSATKSEDVRPWRVSTAWAKQNESVGAVETSGLWVGMGVWTPVRGSWRGQRRHSTQPSDLSLPVCAPDPSQLSVLLLPQVATWGLSLEGCPQPLESLARVSQKCLECYILLPCPPTEVKE